MNFLLTPIYGAADAVTVNGFLHGTPKWISVAARWILAWSSLNLPIEG